MCKVEFLMLAIASLILPMDVCAQVVPKSELTSAGTELRYEDLRAGFLENAQALEKIDSVLTWRSQSTESDQYSKFCSSASESLSLAIEQQPDKNMRLPLENQLSVYSGRSFAHQRKNFQSRLFWNKNGVRKEICNFEASKSPFEEIFFPDLKANEFFRPWESSVNGVSVTELPEGEFGLLGTLNYNAGRTSSSVVIMKKANFRQPPDACPLPIRSDQFSGLFNPCEWVFPKATPALPAGAKINVRLSEKIAIIEFDEECKKILAGGVRSGNRIRAEIEIEKGYLPAKFNV